MLALGHSASAETVLLQENFNAENGGDVQTKYTGFAQFNVTVGAVDLIGPGLADFFPGNGLYVDLDGTSSAAGRLESKSSFALQTGITYRLQFDLGNSDAQFGGGSADNTVTVSLGSAYSETFNRSGLTPFETITRLITPITAVSTELVFQEDPIIGGDNLGVLLDNVSLVAVPVPGLLGSFGLAVGGLLLRSR
ncbi:MAG: hypothetical protein ACI9BW_001836 [Gammaproteobacteria bacterium]|jgi:hypothetical protein